MSRRVNRHRGGARTEAREAEKEQRFQEEKEQRFQEEKESLHNMDENSLYVKLKGEYEKAYKEIYNGDTTRAREKAMTELRKMGGEQYSNKSMKDRYIEEILEFNSTINWFKRRLSGKDKKKKLPKKKNPSSKKKKLPKKKNPSSKKKKKQGGGKSKKSNKAKPRKAKKTNKRPRSIKFKRAGISKLSSRSPERNNPYPF